MASVDSQDEGLNGRLAFGIACRSHTFEKWMLVSPA